MHLLHKNKTVGIITILAGIVALGCLMLSAIAVNYHFEAFNNPSLILSLQGTSAIASKWSMIGDVLGYYLLLLPLIMYLHTWMQHKTLWSQLFTFCGLVYVLIGAIGSSILAIIWPAAMQAYPATAPADQQIIKANFEMVNTMVYGGIWNLLEQLFAGVWWVLPGVLLFRKGYKGIALAGIITGLCSLLDSLSVMVDSDALHQVSLNAYLYLSVMWAIWMGVAIYRKPLLDSAAFDTGKQAPAKRTAISLS